MKRKQTQLSRCRSKEEVAWLIRRAYVAHNPKRPSLAGYCASASHTLASAFKAKGWCAKVVCGPGHAWLESSGTIWDVTATQFGLKEGVVRTKNRQKYAKDHCDLDYRVLDPDNWAALLGDGLAAKISLKIRE